MNITGIIAEYNPFHNGHLYQIQQLHKLLPGTAVIVVMSGSFTQRGEAAILDKWTRASLAAAYGADLILELPCIFASRSAQDFAQGGIRLLDRLGIVNQLAFGAEANDLAPLAAAAAAVERHGFQVLLQAQLSQGLSYAAAIGHTLSQITGIAENSLKKPNNILAVEYLRQLKKLHSSIKPVLIPRHGAGHHDICQDGFASGEAIRYIFQQESQPAADEPFAQTMPTAVFKQLQAAKADQQMANQEYLLRPLLYRLRNSSPALLHSIYGMREGLENRFLAKAALGCSSFAELLASIRSRRYPLTSLSRLCLYLLLDIHKDLAARLDAQGPLYARVLAANDTGRQILPILKQHSLIPIITKTTHYLTYSQMTNDPHHLTPLQEMLGLDIKASDLWSLCLPLPGKQSRDFFTSPHFSRP